MLRGVPGDVAELGVYRGDFAVLLNLAFSERRLHLFDTFDGFDERDIAAERENSYSGAKAGDFGDTAKDGVDKRLFFREKRRVPQGIFPRIRSKRCEDLRFAFVSIDADKSPRANCRGAAPFLGQIVRRRRRPRYTTITARSFAECAER